jgi:hypothetical protein
MGVKKGGSSSFSEEKEPKRLFLIWTMGAKTSRLPVEQEFFTPFFW